ncbi:hypothetical protein PVAND_014025 [Polypedilum vanderplanki]|uniref:Uncharacterized protein n=1 Tax=Polypedilum vanderplanki TaxID=319348 RepID=A0A9J6CSE6_POLVA|nr:hypothetical protein PVAND_014025 [Polypedilum vanderplanki]
MTLPNYEIRDYQEQIYNICLKQNSLIYLPTGSGKTMIAIKVINHFRDEIVEPINKNGKRAVFLVNTVCLAKQHKETIEEVLGLKVSCWTSESKNKTWSKAMYLEKFNECSVIIATAQLFVDAVKHSFISIDQIRVLIFDECHHGRMNHPYHELMKQFQYVDKKLHPRVIGLSGMLVGIANSLTTDNVNDELKKLESTYDAKIVTVNKIQDYLNVLIHSTNPNESFVRYKKFTNCELAEELVERISEIRWILGSLKVPGMTEINPETLKPSRSRKLKELELYFNEVKEELEQMGLFGAYLSLKAIRVQYLLIKKKPGQNKTFLEVVNKCIDYVDELMTLLDEEKDFKNLSLIKILQNISPKMRALILLLKMQFNIQKSIKNLQCLLFVTRRYSAKCLYWVLKKYAEYDKEFRIIPDFVVGINSEIPESIEDALSQNFNNLALKRFRDRETNLICASSVLEEGIDLQMCNLVIMFDYPTTFRCYLQTMGRARIRNSNYIVLLEDNNVPNFLKKRDEMHAIDKELKRILVTKTIDRVITKEDIEREQMEAWEPLITENRALVNSISSIALLNRFVSRYANANLLWSRQDYGVGRVVAILILPSQLDLDNYIIRSDQMPDIKTAKQHAAFKACEILHEKGYLDSNLIPSYII